MKALYSVLLAMVLVGCSQGQIVPTPVPTEASTIVPTKTQPVMAAPALVLKEDIKDSGFCNVLYTLPKLEHGGVSFDIDEFIWCKQSLSDVQYQMMTDHVAWVATDSLLVIDYKNPFYVVYAGQIFIANPVKTGRVDSSGIEYVTVAYGVVIDKANDVLGHIVLKECGAPNTGSVNTLFIYLCPNPIPRN